MVQLFENAHSEQIKTWLTEELGPICDAEPDVLSDYVIALLKHDASEAELAALLNEQLADFLDSKTEPFVAKLVSTLSTKSYLPVDQRPSTSAAIVDITAPSSSSRKRGAEDEPRRSPPKAPRSSDVGIPTGPRGAAKAADGANGSGGARDRDVREKRQAGPSTADRPQAQQSQSRTKELCRDFHQKGWCSRGDSCRWEHSTDAITGGANHGNNGMQAATGPGPAQSMNGPQSHFNGMQGGPPQPMFMGRPPMPSQMAGGFPMFPGPTPGWNGSQSPTPFGGAQSPPGPFQGGPPGFEGAGLAARLGEQRQQHPSPQPPFFQQQSEGQGGFPMGSAPSMGMGGGEGPSRGGFAGRGRGRGGGPPGTFSTRSRSTTTLVIENVPADYLDLVKINDYFKRFGTITNIQIDQPSAKSLVSYSTPAEAKTAHESPEVIFGNRFVKVYFQKLDEPLDGSSSAGPPVVRPPPPQKQTFGAGQNVYRPPGAAVPPTPSPAPSATPEQIAERKQAIETQRTAQDKVNTLITEQKQLMVKLGGKTATPEEKKAGMVRLRELEPIIKQATEEVRKAVAAVAALPANSTSSGTGSSLSSFDPAKKAEQKAKMEKDRLDRELEAHSKVGEPGSQTEELKAKLEALKAEAASLGLNNGDAAAARGGYRGRGAPRGAASFRGATRGRGRGAGAAPSMRLDNRSTKLIVSDIPEGKEAQPVKEWLKNFGDVASFDDVTEGGTGDARNFAVTFKTRQSGEAAVRSTIGGGEVPEVGKVKLVWASAPAPAPAPASTFAPTAATMVDSQEGGSGGVEMDDGDATGDGEGDENWKR